MRGKVRMLFLAILLVAMAGAAYADPIIPMVPGYTTTYEVNWAGVTPSKYTASMKITNDPTQTIDGKDWLTMQQFNWDGDGKTQTMLFYATDTALYIDGSASPHFQTGVASWTDEGGRDVTFSGIINNFITPAGNFDGVYVMKINDYDPNGDLYQILTEYWLPGVGFLGEDVPRSYGGSNLPRTTYITGSSASAVPVPPSLLLLGSGLVGLLGLRGFRNS
jgi:hypothetical protein